MSAYEVAIVSALALLVVVLTAFDLYQQKKNGKMTLETAKEIALSVIARVSLALLTDAERTYGDGTGELKMSSCMTKLIELLPASVVEVVPKSFLQEHLEKALDIAKLKWGKNPRLVNSEKKD